MFPIHQISIPKIQMVRSTAFFLAITLPTISSFAQLVGRMMVWTIVGEHPTADNRAKL